MFEMFRRDPRKRLEREIRSKAELAFKMQRNGKLLECAALTAEVERMEKALAALDRSCGSSPE